ncbi:MAG: AbrB family transcriptional regulator [Synergistales bacterium]|nr:AbrB family transcriptional regulator [Synergistales bacterium]
MNQALVVAAVIAAGIAGYYSPIPAGALVGGLIGGLAAKAVLGLGVEKITLLSVISQMLVAYVIVERSDLSSVRMLPRYIPVAILYSLVLLCFSLVMAWVLSRWLGLDWVTAIFATPPGGLSGLGLAATEVGANAPIALLFHVIRVVLVMTLVPLVASVLERFL